MLLRKKPDPAVYIQTLSKLDLSPRECIVIENTQNGNLAALDAGLKTIITTHYFTTDDNVDGASLVLDQLREPDQPFQANKGITCGSRCVNLQLLQGIFTEEYAHNSIKTTGV